MRCSFPDCDYKKHCFWDAEGHDTTPTCNCNEIEEAHLAGHEAEREMLKKILLHGDVEARREMWNHYLDNIIEDEERLS